MKRSGFPETQSIVSENLLHSIPETTDKKFFLFKNQSVVLDPSLRRDRLNGINPTTPINLTLTEY
jgi:hypothetical protein